MTAIAAVLAFSTPSFAQGAGEPIAATSASAAEVAPAPVAADPLAAGPVVADTPIVADSLAAEAAPAKPAARKVAATKTSAALSRPVAPRTASAAPILSVAGATISDPDAAAPAVEALPVQPEAAPAAAVAATPPAQDASAASNGVLPIAGAVGLGLLGLIGFGVAMRRRKRRAEEVEFEARQSALAETEPSEAPAADPLVAEQPSLPLQADPAPAAPVAASASAQTPSECIEAAPGSHVEAACEGPTADNPSMSIKKRLKRAHFFDQREFLVAAGEAVPVAADAGLPDAVATPEPAPPAREPA